MVHLDLARDAGCFIHVHADGDLRALMDDLLDCGIDVINLQDLVNGIDWIAENLAGKICIDLDIDRQKVTVYGSPAVVELASSWAASAIGWASAPA